MAQKCFPFNEFGPSVLKGTSAFLQNSTCVHGRSAPRHRCFPDGAIPGGLQELSPVSKRPRMADSTPNDRRIAGAERLEVKHQRLASSCWPLTALRLLWNPLDQHGLTAVTLLGYEPLFGSGGVGPRQPGGKTRRERVRDGVWRPSHLPVRNPRE